MSSIFDYIFNLKGNYSVKIDDLTDKTAEFQASVAKSQDALTGLGQACISFESVVNVVKNITDVFTGVTNIGANAELQLINMKTLFGGNAEAAQEMYDRISEYGKVTPYDKAGLIDAQKTMMSFGMSGEQAFSTLKQIEPQVYSASTGAKRSIEELSSIGAAKPIITRGVLRVDNKLFNTKFASIFDK